MNHGSYSYHDPYGQTGSYNASSSASYYQGATSPSSSDSSPTMSANNGGNGDSYQCLFPGCDKYFSRPADLARHYSTVHRQGTGQLIECEFRWCGRTGDRGFTRNDHYREHLREVHQQDIPRSRRRPSSKQTF